MKTIAYHIRKRRPEEALNGYGYEVVIWEDGHETHRESAFATSETAYSWVRDYIRDAIDQLPITKKITIE